MKKIIPVLIFAMLLAVLAACTSTSTMEETYNGITRTETTTTKGDDVSTEVVYTDEDGNVLDPEIGEAAFEAAKAGDEDPLNTVLNAGNEEAAEDAAAAEASDEASGEASDEETCDAAVTLVNDTDAEITEVYIALDDDDSWGYNLLEEPLEAGEELTLDGTLTYADDTLFGLDFVTADGEDTPFNGFTFSGLDDPQNITVTFAFEDGAYCLYIG